MFVLLMIKSTTITKFISSVVPTRVFFLSPKFRVLFVILSVVVKFLTVFRLTSAMISLRLRPVSLTVSRCMKLLKSRKLTKSNCPLFSFFSFVTPRLASYFGKGLNVFIIFSVVLAIVFWCPVKSFALNVPDSNANTTFFNVFQYSDVLNLCTNGVQRIEISYSETFCYCGYDVNHITILLPNNISYKVDDNTKIDTDLPAVNSQYTYPRSINTPVHLFSCDYLLEDVDGNSLSSSYAVITMFNPSFTMAGTIPRDWTRNTNNAVLGASVGYRIFYSYSTGNNNPYCLEPNAYVGSTPSKLWGYYKRVVGSSYTARLVADPYRTPILESPDISEFGLVIPREHGWLFVLGPTYKYFHHIDSIDFFGTSEFDDSGVQEDCTCHCQCVCDCDCGFYTEELKEELIEYYETNLVTREMFEEFVENNTYVANYYESQQEEISSLKDNTEFSSEVDDYYDNADNMFSDINNALDGLDDFDDQLTIGSEIQGAGTIINSMFSNFPPSIIVAMVFVLVMLVVVKIIGR